MNKFCYLIGLVWVMLMAVSCGESEYDKFLKESEANRIAGEKFLAENRTKPGVVETQSGLQYLILEQDSGAVPLATDTVTTHYHGTLINGTVFDSSIERGNPITFPVKGVIYGWQEALVMMPVGSKWRLFIPPHLAYGNSRTGSIGPNSTLIFDVELLEIK